MNRIALTLVFGMFCGLFPASAKNPVAAVAVKAETIHGTVTIVDRDQKMIFIKSDEGIGYDFKIGPTTKILSGDQKLALDDLANQIGHPVEIVFLPLKTGNAARSIALK